MVKKIVLITLSASASILADPQTIGTNVAIVSQDTIVDYYDTIARPDIAASVGPQDVCVVTNQNLASIFKDGSPGSYDTFSAELAPFFYDFNNPFSSAKGEFIGDPQLLFDFFTQRWFYTNLRTISVSNGPILNESTDWKKYDFDYSFAAIGLVPDYDQTGIDEHALIIGVQNFFGRNPGPYVIIVQKMSLLADGPLVANAFKVGSTGNINPVGVTNFDSNPTYSYAIAIPTGPNFTPPASQLQIFQFSNTNTSNPSLQNIINVEIPEAQGPGVYGMFNICSFAGSWQQVPQPYDLYGCFGSAMESLVMAPAHIRDNQLYFCQMLLEGTYSAAFIARWYQVDLTDPNNPCVVQFGDVITPAEINPIYNTPNSYYPTIMTNTISRIVPAAESGCPRDVPTHNLIIGFSSGRQNPTQWLFGFYSYGLPADGDFYNAATIGRLATDPLGQVRQPFTHVTDRADGFDASFYGDYSFSALDPIDQTTIWQFMQTCLSSGGTFAIQATQLLN